MTNLIIIKKIVMFLIFALPFINVNAQDYYFKNFQTENGLAHNTVLALMQDSRGFLWVGTKSGLNRLDGNSIKNFNKKNSPTYDLDNSQIYSICEDKKGLIWFGTNSGLYFYNPIDESFTKPDKTKRFIINKIICDVENRLWFISKDRIYTFNYQKNRIRNTGLLATTISTNAFRQLWFGNRKGQLRKLDMKSRRITTYQVIDSNFTVRYKTISKILSTNHRILIGTEALGLKLFDTDSERTDSIIGKDENGIEIYVRDIIEGSDNNYWIASENGLFKYSLITGNIVNFKKQVGNPFSISDNSVYSLFRDNEGGIWVGTYFGGLNYYSVQTSKFEKYFPSSSVNSLSGSAVREISSINGKNIWIGTEDAGVNMLDTATRKFITYKADGKDNSISYPNIHGLLAEKNRIYIGPLVHGLEILDIAKGKIVSKYPIHKIDGKRTSNFVMSIFRTSKKELLIGTTGSGLFTFDETSKEFHRNDGVPQTAFVYCVAEDRAGTIWTGSLWHGTFFYNPNTGKKGNIKFNGKSGLDNEVDFSIQGILEDSQNNLWFATDGGGLIQLSKNRKTFKRYTTDNGLPSNNLYRILEDEVGNLWVSSLKGLICFNIKTHSIKTFTIANGLLTDQFNYNSAYKDPKGKMYFGCVKGLIAFVPSSFDKPLPAPPLYITNFQINNQDVIPKSKDSPLKKSILDTDSIILNYKQSNFNIEFAAVSFSSPEVIRYKYKMEGLDNSWTYLKNNRKAYFTDLSPGDYVFKVIAESNIDSWKPMQKVLFVKILPPFWKTLEAYIFYALIFLLVLYLSVNYYKKDMETKNRRKLQVFELKKESEVYHAKIEFFTTIAHEIQTPLTLIKGPIGWAIEKIGEDPLKKTLLMVEKNTDRLLSLTSHLLDFRKAEINEFGLNFVNTNIAMLLRDQIDLFEPDAQKKGISLIFKEPRPNFTAFVDPEAFTKITANLLSNSIKYAKEKVSLKLFFDKLIDGFFIIEYVNDGDIIAKEDQLLIFKPFFRASNSKSKPGTGIGLSLAKSLSELHNGELKLLSSENNLTTFRLSIPIRQKFEFILGK